MAKVNRGPNRPRGTPAQTPSWKSIANDNLLNFNEGTSTTGWSVTSGSGSFSQSGSSVRLTSSSAVVTGELSLTGPTSTDCIFLLNFKAKYTASQFGTVRLVDGTTTVLDISLGYDHAAGAASLGCVSAHNGTSGDVIATGVDYETGSVTLAIHVDRTFSCVNLFYKESGGKWDFRGSFAYAAGFASLDLVRLITSAHNGQWIEYDWLGYCRPNAVVIGDSIAAGHNGYDPDPVFYGGEDDYDTTWMKHATLYSSLRNSLIVCKGIGGSTSTEIKNRIADATDCSPRVVFLHASSNDYGASITQATRTSNIQSCINSIAAVGAQTVLLNQMYGTSAHSQNTSGQLRDYGLDFWNNYRGTLTGLAASIDIMQPVLGASNYQSAALTDDTIHPTIAGYTAIGEQILAV